MKSDTKAPNQCTLSNLSVQWRGGKESKCDVTQQLVVVLFVMMREVSYVAGVTVFMYFYLFNVIK